MKLKYGYGHLKASPTTRATLFLLLIPAMFITTSIAFRALQPSILNARPISASRLLSTLAVLEHRGGKVSSGSLPCVTAASKIGGSVTAFIAGSDSASIAEQAAKLEGVEKVLHVPNGAYDKVYPPPPVSLALTSLLKHS